MKNDTILLTICIATVLVFASRVAMNHGSSVNCNQGVSRSDDYAKIVSRVSQNAVDDKRANHLSWLIFNVYAMYAFLPLNNTKELFFIPAIHEYSLANFQPAFAEMNSSILHFVFSMFWNFQFSKAVCYVSEFSNMSWYST